MCLSPKSFTQSLACCEPPSRAAPASACSSPCSCSLEHGVSGVLREIEGGHIDLKTCPRLAVVWFCLLVCRTSKRLEEDSYPNKGCRKRPTDHSCMPKTGSSCHPRGVRCCSRDGPSPSLSCEVALGAPLDSFVLLLITGIAEELSVVSQML
jgi:hypothetical protein